MPTRPNREAPWQDPSFIFPAERGLVDLQSRGTTGDQIISFKNGIDVALAGIGRQYVGHEMLLWRLFHMLRDVGMPMMMMSEEFGEPLSPGEQLF